MYRKPLQYGPHGDPVQDFLSFVSHAIGCLAIFATSLIILWGAVSFFVSAVRAVTGG